AASAIRGCTIIYPTLSLTEQALSPPWDMILRAFGTRQTDGVDKWKIWWQYRWFVERGLRSVQRVERVTTFRNFRPSTTQASRSFGPRTLTLCPFVVFVVTDSEQTATA